MLAHRERENAGAPVEGSRPDAVGAVLLGAEDDAGELESPATAGGAAPVAVEAETGSAVSSSAEKNDDAGDTPRPDDDGSKGGGRGHLKVVK